MKNVGGLETRIRIKAQSPKPLKTVEESAGNACRWLPCEISSLWRVSGGCIPAPTKYLLVGNLTRDGKKANSFETVLTKFLQEGFGFKVN